MGPTVGWNNLLIVLFWPINYAQMAPGRAESAFGLLDPAGLNWHFGAETDLFNFQCSSHSDGHRMPSVVVHLFLFFHYKISVRFRKIAPSFIFVSSLFHLMLQCNIQQSLSVEKQFFFWINHNNWVQKRLPRDDDCVGPWISSTSTVYLSVQVRDGPLENL